jgi:hypothetical protein
MSGPGTTTRPASEPRFFDPLRRPGASWFRVRFAADPSRPCGYRRLLWRRSDDLLQVDDVFWVAVTQDGERAESRVQIVSAHLYDDTLSTVAFARAETVTGSPERRSHARLTEAGTWDLRASRGHQQTLAYRMPTARRDTLAAATVALLATTLPRAENAAARVPILSQTTGMVVDTSTLLCTARRDAGWRFELRRDDGDPVHDTFYVVDEGILSRIDLNRSYPGFRCDIATPAEAVKGLPAGIKVLRRARWGAIEKGFPGTGEA